MKKVTLTLMTLGMILFASCASETVAEEALYMDKDLVHLSCCSDMGEIIVTSEELEADEK